MRKIIVAGAGGFIGHHLAVRGRNSDNSLCKKILGWAPEIDLETGIAKTYEWVKAQVEKNAPQRCAK
ncbi:MAG: hypothetical protein V1927_00115 [Candidatus Omnitrophota bacterium]